SWSVSVAAILGTIALLALSLWWIQSSSATRVADATANRLMSRRYPGLSADKLGAVDRLVGPTRAGVNSMAGGAQFTDNGTTLDLVVNSPHEDLYIKSIGTSYTILIL